MAAHLGSKGVVLFGPHTSAEKVSIETNYFKPMSSDPLDNLSAQSVWEQIQSLLKS